MKLTGKPEVWSQLLADRIFSVDRREAKDFLRFCREIDKKGSVIIPRDTPVYHLRNGSND